MKVEKTILSESCNNKNTFRARIINHASYMLLQIVMFNITYAWMDRLLQRFMLCVSMYLYYLLFRYFIYYYVVVRNTSKWSGRVHELQTLSFLSLFLLTFLSFFFFSFFTIIYIIIITNYVILIIIFFPCVNLDWS